jgi:hypothetical protein
MVKRAMISVLVLSVVALFFACGDENLDLKPATRANVAKLLSQTVQCSNAATIAAGAYHTVGLKEDRTVVAVGYNYFGQLNVSSWTNIKAIAAGMYHTVGLKEDGIVTAVGSNSDDQLNVSSWTNIKAIAAGAHHTVGLKEDGTVVAVGSDSDGQLNVSSWTNIKAIAAGVYHTVGLKEDGSVVAVGSNSDGQLNVSSWTNIKAIATGAYHTVGLKEDGTVVAVGSNSDGQLNVSSWTNIKAIAGGMYHTVGLKEDGTVVAVGSNHYGQLKVSSFTNIMPVCESNKTPPTITATVSPDPNANGWNNADVTVTFICNDSLSGIASCPSPMVVTTEGTGQVITGSAVDMDGNSATASVTVNIDKTPPSFPFLSASPSILWPPNHKMMDVLIKGSVTDGGSGIASTIITVADEYGIYNMTVPGFGSTIPLESWCAGTDKDGRLYTISAVTTDKAGNQSTATTTVLVPHDMR